MSYAKFADAFKASKDLLSKPYPEGTKIELKGTSASGPAFIAEAYLGAPAKGAVASARAENLFALSNFKVDKFSVDSDNVVATEFSLAEAVKATKLTFTAEDAYRHRVTSKQGGKADFTVEHKAAAATVTAVVDALGKGVKLSAVGGHNGVFAGAYAQFTQAEKLRDYAFLLGYKKADVTFGVASVSEEATKKGADGKAVQGADGKDEKVVKPLDAFEVSVHSKVNSTVEVAGKAKIPKAFAAGAVDISAGLTYKYAADTTLAAKAEFKGKDASRKAFFSYAQQVSPLAKITIGAEVNIAELAKDDHKLNVALALSA